MRKAASILVIFIFTLKGFSQEDSGKKIEFSGYVSTMMSSMFDSVSGPFINDNLLHNRLNFKAYITPGLNVVAEIRNRLFTGDLVRSGLSLSTITAADQGIADLSWNIIDRQSFFLNTTIDRLWLDLSVNKLQARIGRQRINWGQALVWNPNDIFNAYSYFDFDYVERPGSDAIRLQYFTGASSVVELAVKGNARDKVTAAALYRFNKWGYDIQFLGGILENDELTFGTGWSGAFGATSFRGEGTWFQPFRKFTDAAGTGMITLGLDRIFGDNSMAQAQFMLCNKPFDPGNFGSLYTRTMSVKSLAFSKFSAFASYTYPITPLFNLGLSGMWFPDLKGYFSGLSADYSVAENVDFSFLWQHFLGNFGTGRTRMNILFIRYKISF